VSAVPLLSGDAGVAQTVDLMRRLIDDATKDPAVNRLAVEILKNSGAPQHDPLAEAEAIYAWVHANIRFVNDPVDSFGDPKETLRPARAILDLRAGDCDDFTILMSSLLQNIGLQTHIVTVASDPRDPSQFTHVYPEVDIDGQWVPVDAARPGAAFGLAPSRAYRRKEWGSANWADSLRGMAMGHVPQRRFSLAGYAHMRGLRRLPLGDETSDLTALITAAGTASANDILASNAASQNIYGTVTTAPGAAAISPYAGYSTLTAEELALAQPNLLGTSSTTWILLGVGILAIAFAMKGK
jgi:hypothetical protein